MKIESTTKVTLDTADQRAVNTVRDILTDIFDKMNSEEVLEVFGEQYDRDYIEGVKVFLTDLWQNGDTPCEITEG